jgi:hypothetical protein
VSKEKNYEGQQEAEKNDLNRNDRREGGSGKFFFKPCDATSRGGRQELRRVMLVAP